MRYMPANGNLFLLCHCHLPFFFLVISQQVITMTIIATKKSTPEPASMPMIDESPLKKLLKKDNVDANQKLNVKTGFLSIER